MKTPLISFYSDIEETTYYSEHASRIIKECEELEIPYDIQKKESLGSYQLNCLSKPQYILDKMEELNCPVLWMDIDSKIHKPLDIYDDFDESVDVIVATANGRLSGMKASPLYFGNTEKSKEFIKAWISTTKDILENGVGVFDHEPLFSLIPMFINKMNIQYVGPQYCIWPGYTNEDTYVTMGLADAESKKESLRTLGIAEDAIEWQSPGNKV
jgi:hypothetical protein|tara:strand:+ start:439 stop:1077 length:639 start_codon:yes stop_codon:yes gene_type:complete